MSICEINCDFISYNYETQESVCSCGIKTEIPLMKDIKFDKNVLFKSFTNINNIANIKIMKCYKTVFKKENIIKNIGFFIFIFDILLNLIFLFLYCFKYYKILIGEIKKFKLNIINLYKSTNNKKIKNKQILAPLSKNRNNQINNIEENNLKKLKSKSKIKKEKKQKKKINSIKVNSIKINNNNDENNDNFIPKGKKGKSKKLNKIKRSKIIKKPLNHYSDINMNSKNNNNSDLKLEFNREKNGENIEEKKEIKLNNSELNNLEFGDAIIKDKRSFIQYYISLLRMNHSVLFIFNSDDLNSRIIKLNF